MSTTWTLRLVDSHPHIHRCISKAELKKRLRTECRIKYVTSAQWFRVAELYLKLNHGNISPINIGTVHSELFHLQNHCKELARFCRERLFVYFGVGAGDTEMALADLAMERRERWEGVLVDVNPTFLKMFVRSLANRGLEDRRYNFEYLAVQTLFETLRKPMISPTNAQYQKKVFVCLGSTIGNFDATDDIWAIFGALANKGDHLLVSYQTSKYLPIVFEKYRQHPGYRTLIGNFLAAADRLEIEWKLNEEKSTIEAWYGEIQLFRSRKFVCEEVTSCAKRHGWQQVLR